jgi:penicillin-binding protein 2
LGYDLPTGKRNVPSSKTYKKSIKWMEKHHHCIKRYWSREVLMTPIQLANMMATVANEGYYYTPHYQKIKGGIDPKFRVRHETIDKKNILNQ